VKRLAIVTVACSLVAGLALADSAHDPTPLPLESRVPGGIALLDLGAATNEPGPVFFNGHRTPVVPTVRGWTAVVGIPLDTEPGAHEAQLKSADARTNRSLPFVVAPKQYAEQRLQVENSHHVDPDKDDLQRIDAERVRIDRALNTYSTDLLPPWTMPAPVPGTRSSSFGLRRFFNGQPRNPHSGMDIAAPTGTPILSPAAGRVVEAGDFFFNGNTVFVDHGLGVVTMYCHLSRVDVKPGDRVEVGTQLGLVGATGRVTGPHLHWSIGVNRAMVDPVLFLPREAPAAAPAGGR
jgi:murein DD-endopeptidase MepM/ murein hydrolase activator NlpD